MSALKTKPLFDRVALIGLGLIGSSLCHVMRARGLVKTIVGTARTKATLDTALQLGLIDEGFEDGWRSRARCRPGGALRARERLWPCCPRDCG